MEDEKEEPIIMMAIMGFLGVAIMTLRLAMRKARRQKFNLSDYLTMAALVLLCARTAFTTIVVLWGNNNITEEYRDSHVFSDTEVYQREIGSKFTIVNRLTYNTYIWIQKSVVLLLYHQFLFDLDLPRRIIKAYWIVLAVTYVVSQVTTFVDCTPVHLYWQVIPDPGSCPKAQFQLIIFVTLNIVTDFMLIILPMPWLIGMKRSIKERLQLIALFSIGFFVIAVAFVRLPIKWGESTTQPNRNIWGSVEAFAAAVVANFPTLFALRKRPTRRDERVGSYGLQRGARVEGVRRIEKKAELDITAVEIEYRPGESARSNDLSSPRSLKWDKGGGESKDDLV